MNRMLAERARLLEEGRLSVRVARLVRRNTTCYVIREQNAEWHAWMARARKARLIAAALDCKIAAENGRTLACAEIIARSLAELPLRLSTKVRPT